MRIVRVLAAAAAALMLSSTFVGGPDPVAASVTSASVQIVSANGKLTDTGRAGVDDLRECLAQNGSVLNVYYLIDNSGSMAQTDPGVVRADLLANSLRELATLRDDISVSFAAGHFSTGFSALIPWTALDAGNVDAQVQAFEDRMRGTAVQAWTNWLVAIEQAQAQLAAQNAVAPGCQALIWLTDGAIDLGRGPAANDSAVNALCGELIRPNGAAPAPGSRGAFAELRQAGVSVFGVLYLEGAVNEYAGVMHPLVEGQHNGVRCGGEEPAESSRGVYLHATSVDDLAVVFMQLGALVGGGTESPFGADGAFEVDPGIASFSIVTTGSDWRLESPAGRVYTAADAGDLDVAPAANAARITSPILHPDDAGTWTWSSSSSADTLYFASGLRMQLDEPGTFLAGADNELSGRIIRDRAPAISLDAYNFSPLELSVVTVDGEEIVPVDDVEFSRETGEFTFHYRATNASGHIELQARLSDIVTVPSRTPVADIAARQQVLVTLSTNYPTIAPVPVSLGELSGADGLARGTFTIAAPADQTAGSVCFPGGLTPTVTNDAADRADTWVWTHDIATECVELAPGESVDVELTAANVVAANSDVSAHFRVQYLTASGETIEGSVPVAFASTRPVNAVAFGALAIALLAAGLLLPLAMLWLFGWWFARVNRGKNLYRASVPVRVTPDGTVTAADDSPLVSLPWGIEQFRFHRVEDDSRRFNDPELGEISARMPLNPFGNPWYQLEPKASVRLIGPQGTLPAKLESRRAAGRLLGIPGDLGRVWAIAISEAALAGDPTEPFSAQLVAYLRTPSADAETFTNRIASIASDPSISRQLRSIRTNTASTEKPRKVRRSNSPAVVDARTDDEPPRRSSSAPSGDEPPRRDRPAQAPSEPPRRDRSRSGISDPPRREGTSPSYSDPPRRERSSGSAADPPHRQPRPRGGDEPPRRDR